MTIRLALQTPCHPSYQTRGMNLSRMTRLEIEALLKILTYMEREELVLIMKERRVAERSGPLH